MSLVLKEAEGNRKLWGCSVRAFNSGEGERVFHMWPSSLGDICTRKQVIHQYFRNTCSVLCSVFEGGGGRDRAEIRECTKYSWPQGFTVLLQVWTGNRWLKTMMLRVAMKMVSGAWVQIVHMFGIVDLILGRTPKNHLIQSWDWKLGRASQANVMAKAKMWTSEEGWPREFGERVVKGVYQAGKIGPVNVWVQVDFVFIKDSHIPQHGRKTVFTGGRSRG